MKKLLLFLVFATAACSQARQSFNTQQTVLWRFVVAVPDASSPGLLKCTQSSSAACSDVVAGWNKFFVASKQWEGASGISATDALLRKIAEGAVQPKLGCADWDCGSSTTLLARLNSMRDIATRAKSEYIRSIIQASAKDDKLADLLASQVFR